MDIRLVVGLGNPGATYTRNRHNIGFIAVEALARSLNASWQQKPKLELAETRVGTGKITLMKPLTFMNASGEAVVPFARFHKLEPAQILVIHDDLDLPFGRVRVRTGGSSGGQNGLKSITERLGTDGFVRLKLGISRPPAQWSVINWVLSNFQPEESAMLEEILKIAVDAAGVIVRDGVQEAQNRFNSTDLRPKPLAPEKLEVKDKTDITGVEASRDIVLES